MSFSFIKSIFILSWRSSLVVSWRSSNGFYDFLVDISARFRFFFGSFITVNIFWSNETVSDCISAVAMVLIIKYDWQNISLKSVTDSVDCKLMLTLSLRGVLVFQMSVFRKCKISFKSQSVKLSAWSSRFLIWYILKEIILWYSVLG